MLNSNHPAKNPSRRHLPVSRSHTPSVGGDIPAGAISGVAPCANKMASVQGKGLQRAGRAGSAKWENWGGSFGKDRDKSAAPVSVGMRCPIGTGFVGKAGRHFMEKGPQQTGIVQGFLLSSALLPGSVHSARNPARGNSQLCWCEHSVKGRGKSGCFSSE